MQRGFKVKDKKGTLPTERVESIPQLRVAPFPRPVHPTRELASSQGAGRAGKKGKGAAWHREAVWACVACAFSEPLRLRWGKEHSGRGAGSLWELAPPWVSL